MNFFTRKPPPKALVLPLFFLLQALGSSAQTVRCHTENGKPVDGVTLNVRTVDGQRGIIEPEKDGDFLDGVTILDLILIRNHIIGLEILNSPYKMIAADVDMSGTVSAHDVLVLRKMLLGIPSSKTASQAMGLPVGHAKSWRFVPKGHVVVNPLEHSFPEHLDEFPTQTLNTEFVAIKIGSVTDEPPDDGQAQEDPTAFQLAVPDAAINAGEYHTLPILSQADAPLNAWQMGIRFDHNALEFVGVSQGDLPGLKQDNFGLTKVAQGEIRALWMANLADEDDFVRPGQVLFHLTFRARTDIADISQLLRTDDGLLRGLGLSTDKSTYRFDMSPQRKVAERDEVVGMDALLVRCLPNPSTDGFALEVESPEASKARLVVYDAFGRRVLFRELMLDAGKQTLPLPEASRWPAGVYRWDLRAGKSLRSKGHAVKL